MVHIRKLRAAKKHPPGYFITDQLEIRDWTQSELAEVLGISQKHLSNIIQGNKPISFDLSKLLAEVFDTSPQYWINLDTNYRLWLEGGKSDNEKDVDTKATIYERMPVRDMIEKGWLKKPESVDDLKEQVLDFWNLKSLDFSELDKNIIPCLTRKSSAYNQFNISYAATWYQKAQIIASTYKVPQYNQSKLEKLYDTLHSYTSSSKNIKSFLDDLNKTGTIFFVLPHLQKTYLDGAAFLHGSNPVIVYTGRYKRIDNFWFTISHEIAHVLKHLDRNTPVILDNLNDGEKNDLDKEANLLASKKLKHPEIKEYLSPYLHYLTASKIIECANKYQIHPSIVIGKLAYDKNISYRNLSLYNDNVLKYIPNDFLVI